MRRVLLVVLLGASAAVAEPADPPPRPPASDPHGLPFALGVNLPFGWGEAASVGASLFVGVTEHDAVRANFATYRYLGGVPGDLIALAVGGDGDDSARTGRTTDLGIAWCRYPRQLWSGLTYELGLLRRAGDLRAEDELAAPPIVATDTTTYAGRVQVGWSWLLEDHLFIAVAIGASLGYETGTEVSDDVLHPMPTTHDVARYDVSGEGYLRLGFAR